MGGGLHGVCQGGSEPDYFLQIVDIPSVPEGGHEAVFHLPVPGKSDALRGTLPPTMQVFDETGGALVQVDIPTGNRTTVGPTSSRTARSSVWFSGWHWGIASGVILLAGVYLWRRVRHAA
jgi:hypothetical protein